MRTIHDIENHRRARRKELLLAVIDEFRTQIENNEVLEFVIGAINEVGDVDVAVAAHDRFSAVGILEIAKQRLIIETDEYEYGEDDEYGEYDSDDPDDDEDY